VQVVPGLMLLIVTSAVSAYLKYRHPSWLARVTHKAPSWLLGDIVAIVLAAATLLAAGGVKAAFVAAVSGGALTYWIVRADRLGDSSMR
jgi:hypothetical protein